MKVAFKILIQITVLNTQLFQIIPKVISKSKSTSLNKASIKNVYGTLWKQSDKYTKYETNKSTQNSENFSDNIKETIDKFTDDFHLRP